MPVAPIRTPAGEEELRHRNRKLGQRYRTVLLLVDGRRPLEELLSLAQKAGAATSHFEELVQLGLIDVPAEPAVAGAPPAVDAAAQPDPAVEADAREEAAVSNAPVEDLPAPEPVAEPLQRTPAPHVPRAPGDSAPELEASSEERLLQEARDLLIDTLRIDSPLFGARTFFRVRSAESASDLIDLVWEIEDHLARSRHSRDELISLQRARELLGMGNTRVAGDTHSGVHE